MAGRKVKSKRLSALKKKCWELFSQFIRRSHANENGWSRCYTCDTVGHWKQLQCGHAIPGRHNAVLLDAEICRPQCAICNVFKHGQLHIFTTKLICENGDDWWLKKLAQSNVPIKISRDNYAEMIEDLKRKLEIL